MTTFLSFLALILLLLMCIAALVRARNYWMRRALFFEAQAYELLRSKPIFRHDDPADWWRHEENP
jgi:hypothetical protein